MSALEWLSVVALVLIAIGLVASIVVRAVYYRENKRRRAELRRELTEQLRGSPPREEL